MSEVEGTDGRLLAGRYRLGALLGKGGMGTVWRAVDETLGRSVAVKELRFGSVDEDEKRRMITRTLREAKATARIRNTGAITVFDVVEEDDRPWIVMELVEGRSLADVIREDGPLTPARAAEVGLVVLDVLKAAHAEGILHRDVKPSNVLVAHDDRVVLGDFGIAQIDGDPSVTSTGMLVGAPSYISPERARGHKPGPPADLWSLGALLYAAVEGRPPYDKGSAIATLTAVMTEPIGPMPNAGPLADVIRGLLAKDPAQRLDEPGARAMLTAVRDAPAAQAAPPAGSGDARTAVLPADAQPTPVLPVQTAPVDAPSDARADAPAVRRGGGAFRPGRQPAARTPAPGRDGTASAGTAAGPGGPGAPNRPAATGVSSGGGLRRTPVLVVALVVLALLGTVIGVALANSGGSGGSGGKGDKGRNGTHPSTASGTSGSSKHTGASGGDGSDPSSASGRPSSPDRNGPTDPNGHVLPAGWHNYHDAEGFWIALPPGWKRVGDNHYGTGSTFAGADGRKLLVDWTHTPGSSALADWQRASKGDNGNGYQLIKVKPAYYRGYDAADWEFTRIENGTRVHVLNRGFVVDGSHGYAIMFTTPDAGWKSEANRLARLTFFASFKPA